LSHTFQSKYREDEAFRESIKDELGTEFFKKAKPLIWETSYHAGDEELDIILKFLDACLTLKIYEDVRKYMPSTRTEEQKEESAFKRFSYLVSNPNEINRRIYPCAINPMINYNGFVTHIEVDPLIRIRAVDIFDQIYFKRNTSKRELYNFKWNPYLFDFNKDCPYIQDFLNFTTFCLGHQSYMNCSFGVNFLGNPIGGGSSGKFDFGSGVRTGLNDVIELLYLWRRFRNLAGTKIYDDLSHFLKNVASALHKGNPTQEIADIITSWEFIALGGGAPELSEKFRQFMTALSGSPLFETRARTYEVFKTGYYIRSKSNHGDKLEREYKLGGINLGTDKILKMIKNLHLSVFKNVLLLCNLNKHDNLDELRNDVKNRIVTGLIA